jgi:hypothetical protein
LSEMPFIIDFSNLPWCFFVVLYHDLVHYFRYASSAYTAVCPRPNGQHLVFPVLLYYY